MATEYVIVAPFRIDGLEFKAGDTITLAQAGPFLVDLVKAGAVTAPKGIVLPYEPHNEQEP